MMGTWTWRKSTWSAGTGDCVEVGTSPETPLIGVRDSKMGDSGPVLTFTPGQMAMFLRATKVCNSGEVTC